MSARRLGVSHAVVLGVGVALGIVAGRRKKREATYRANEIDGTVREWDETGKALPEQEWRGGRQVR